MGSHWDTMVGQDLPDTWSRCSHRSVVVKKPGIGRSFVRLFPSNCIWKMLQNASLDSVIYYLALGNEFVCLAYGNKFICLALGKKFMMNQTFYTKEGDQHFVVLTETVIIFNENNTCMSRINSVLLLQVLPSCDVFGVAVLPGL